MHNELRELADLQRQVFTTADAARLGYGDRDIRRAVDAGQWVRLRRGAFVFSDVWAAADDDRRHLLVARAVARPLAGRVALSHTTATVALGVRLWRPDLRRVHLTRLDGRSGGIEHGVVHHDFPAGTGSPQPVVDADGIDPDFVVLPAAESVAGAMLLHGLDQAVVMGDSAVHLGVVDDDALVRVTERWELTPYSRHARLAARLVDGRAESPGETRGRLIFWRAGLPRPELQLVVRGRDGQRARTDYGWPELGVVGEFDGKVKYLRSWREGETASEVVAREKAREEWITEAGWLVRRIIWGELATPRVVIERFRRAFESAARHIA